MNQSAVSCKPRLNPSRPPKAGCQPNNFLALLFGVITIFGFAPFYVFPLSVVGIIGLFWLLDEKFSTKKQYILGGFAYGFGYFLREKNEMQNIAKKILDKHREKLSLKARRR